MKVVHFKREPHDEYIGRPSKWGNPFTHIADKKTAAQFIVASREEAVQKYKEWILEGDGQWLLDHLHELEGKTLGCWCAPKLCHGNALIEIINERKKMNNEETIKVQQELIDVLYSQVVDLSMMSKIELGDDVIAEIKRLKDLLNKKEDEGI